MINIREREEEGGGERWPFNEIGHKSTNIYHKYYCFLFTYTYAYIYRYIYTSHICVYTCTYIYIYNKDNIKYTVNTVFMWSVGQMVHAWRLWCPCSLLASWYPYHCPLFLPSSYPPCNLFASCFLPAFPAKIRLHLAHDDEVQQIKVRQQQDEEEDRVGGGGGQRRAWIEGTRKRSWDIKLTSNFIKLFSVVYVNIYVLYVKIYFIRICIYNICISKLTSWAV